MPLANRREKRERTLSGLPEDRAANRKPAYQILIERAVYLLLGATALGALIDSISSAFTIKPHTALAFSIVLIILWLSAECALRLRPVSWVANGHKVMIKRLGIQPRLGITGALILLWFPILFHDESPKSPRQLEMRQPSSGIVNFRARLWYNSPSPQRVSVSRGKQLGFLDSSGDLLIVITCRDIVIEPDLNGLSEYVDIEAFYHGKDWASPQAVNVMPAVHEGVKEKGCFPSPEGPFTPVIFDERATRIGLKGRFTKTRGMPSKVKIKPGRIVQPIDPSDPSELFQPVVVCAEIELLFGADGQSALVDFEGFGIAPGIQMAPGGAVWEATRLVQPEIQSANGCTAELMRRALSVFNTKLPFKTGINYPCSSLDFTECRKDFEDYAQEYGKSLKELEKEGQCKVVMLREGGVRKWALKCRSLS